MINLRTLHRVESDCSSSMSSDAGSQRSGEVKKPRSRISAMTKDFKNVFKNSFGIKSTKSSNATKEEVHRPIIVVGLDGKLIEDDRTPPELVQENIPDDLTGFYYDPLQKLQDERDMAVIHNYNPPVETHIYP
jgi:hypothetical protein